MAEQHRIEAADEDGVMSGAILQVTHFMLEMKPGQKLTIERYADPAQMFRLLLQRGIQSADLPKRALSTKDLERIHILRTLVNYGPMYAGHLVSTANAECDHDMLDGLPEINPRGVASKLNAMSLDGLVQGSPKRQGMWWRVTDKGRDLAGSIG